MFPGLLILYQNVLFYFCFCFRWINQNSYHLRQKRKPTTPETINSRAIGTTIAGIVTAFCVSILIASCFSGPVDIINVVLEIVSECWVGEGICVVIEVTSISVVVVVVVCVLDNDLVVWSETNETLHLDIGSSMIFQFSLCVFPNSRWSISFCHAWL